MKEKTIKLAECGVMTALATALSFVKLWKMPLGGSVTLFSMLPISLIGIKNGWKYGLGTGIAYSLIQLFQSVIQGDVFPYLQGVWAFVICILFDYIIPFTVLGLSGVFKKIKPFRDFGIYLGVAVTFIARFLCHFVTGVTIWGQWDEASAYTFSLAYNGQYMGVELLLSTIALVLLLNVRQIRKILCIDDAVKTKTGSDDDSQGLS